MEGVTIDVKPEVTTDEAGRPCVYIPIPKELRPAMTRLDRAGQALRGAEQEWRDAEDAFRQKAIAMGVYRGG